MPVKINVLGISGTVIKDGNCDTLVKIALEGAKELSSPELGEVETDFVTLADKNIAGCEHCQWCIENKARCKIKDDFHAVAGLIDKADGLILAGPVWMATLSPPLLIFIARTRAIVFLTQEWRNKVAGALTLGFFGFGQDNALSVIKEFMAAHQIIPVAQGSALASTAAFGQRPSYLEHGVVDNKRGVLEAKYVGNRVVEVARMIKHATDSGVVLPMKDQLTPLGGHRGPGKWAKFVEGVWR